MNDFPRTRNWRAAPVYEKPKSARLVLARAMGISTDEAGDALTALIQGGYGIAPRNPTNGMLIAYMEALTPPSNHESVVTAIGKARVRWQAMLAQGTEMAMSRKRLPAQRIEARSDETAQPAQPEGREPGSEGMRPERGGIETEQE
jgi:hypothetical protein